MMSGKQNFNAATPPKYLNDFSKALASEVRILLEEVGKLRDERRALQFEIAELMSMKSKHGAGGEYSPDWKPKEQLQPEQPPAPPVEAPPADEGAPIAAKPGWRVVPKEVKREKRHRGGNHSQALTAPSNPAPAPPPEPPKSNLPSWAQWRPNPLLAAPAAQPGTPGGPLAAPASRAGLFGPPSPPPK